MSEYNAEVSPLLVGASTSYETPSPISLNGDSIQTRVYAKRWGVLFVFSFLSVMNNLTQYSFSPISLITQDYYNVSSLKVNLLAVVFMITGFTTRFIAMWIIDNKGKNITFLFSFQGLGTGIFIAAILNLIGSWVRYFPGFENYYWLFVGQSICIYLSSTVHSPLLGAVAQSFIDIAGPKIAANWFPPKERTTATAFSQGPIFISLLLAYAIVPHAVKQDTVKHDLPMYLLIEAILTTASTVFIFLFFRGFFFRRFSLENNVKR